MAFYKHQPDLPSITAAQKADWSEIPSAVAADMLNRAQTVGSRVQPLFEGIRLVGRARTVQCMVGDNGPIQMFMRYAEPGDVLVVDGGGFTDTALWGGLLTEQAVKLGVAGVVADAGLRDVAEIRERKFPCYGAGINPAGPHKGFGGAIDGPISCAGCPVSPGDLVLGDDDGVTIVPHAQLDDVLAACREKLASEAQLVADIQSGKLLVDRLGLPEPELV